MTWWKEIYDFMYTDEDLWYPTHIMRELTIKEVDSLIEILKPEKKTAILDVGCGRGRHSIEFAKRGFDVTGVDISKNLVDLAKKEWQDTADNADELKDKPGKCDFQVLDMRKIEYKSQFDIVLFMDVAFGIFDDVENEMIVRKVFQTLKPGGKAFFSLFNPYYWSVHPHTRHWGNEKGEVIRTYSFNAEEGRVEDRQIYINIQEGIRKEIPTQSLRAYTFPEMKRMCRNAGFNKADLRGDSGDFIPNPGIAFNPIKSMGMYVLAMKNSI